MTNPHIMYCQYCGKKIGVGVGRYIGGGSYTCDNGKCEKKGRKANWM